MNYYRVWFNENDEVNWILGNEWERDGKPIDIWSYVQCVPGQRHPYPLLKVRRPGVKTNFELAGPEQVPVASPHVAELLSRLAGNDIERISASVDDGTQMEIINVIACVDGIDFERSIVECFGPHDKIRPEKAGEIHVVYRLVLDPTRIGNHKIFRLRDWMVPLIVAEPIKQLLESQGGAAVFQPIPTDGQDRGRIEYWDNNLRKKVTWLQHDREQFLRQLHKA